MTIFSVAVFALVARPLVGLAPAARTARATAPPAELVLPPGPPASPRDVLVFWFGREYYADPAALERADYLRARARVWFGGGAAVDAAARRFAPLIRAAGRGGGVSLGPERAWAERDGLVARLVLLDQLSRNAFRGSAEAFAYDARAREAALALVAEGRAAEGRAPRRRLPSAAVAFVITCLSHSEDLALHARAAAYGREQLALAEGGSGGAAWLRRQVDESLADHTRVLERFGRYPHRNAACGRVSTGEEVAWLASADCPGWARSQDAASSS